MTTSHALCVGAEQEGLACHGIGGEQAADGPGPARPLRRHLLHQLLRPTST